MLSELSIRITVAPAALLSFAALPPLKNGRVNAMTISRIARQRSSSSSRFCKRAAADGALRDLADKDERRELDATRTCASHKMHENRRRERRDAEKK